MGSASDISLDAIGAALPQSEPCYCLLAWPHASANDSNRNLGVYFLATISSKLTQCVVFIYSCPSSSPIKHRMLYSCSSAMTFQAIKNILDSSSSLINIQSRKIETSDPQELNEVFLITELGLDANKELGIVAGDSKKAFARPKGPPRRR